MEPQVQFVRTSDGVSIAYARAGTGPPVVMAPNLWTSIGLFFQILPEFIEGNLAHGREAVFFDSRGTGASQRDVGDVSLETRLLDLEAVVDALALDTFVLMGVSHAGPTSIAYAARHPDRVSKLILATTYANGAAYYTQAPVMRAFASMEDMARDQWEFYTRTAANAVLGFHQPEVAERLALLYRDSITPDMLIKYRDASRHADVTQLLPAVSCPTLVLDDKNSALRVEELSRELASRIPGARLASFEGTGTTGGEGSRLAIEEFLDPDAVADVRSTVGPSAFRTVLFTDLVGHTEMMQRMGDERGRAVLREHERITREMLRQYGGAEVKTMGDGFLASFGSLTRAIDCAIALQRAFDEGDFAGSRGDSPGLQMRIGLNAGEPIEEDGDLFGSTVILASRIAAHAGPGEILIPEHLRHLLAGKSYVYADRGEAALKGFEDAVRLFEVRWRG